MECQGDFMLSDFHVHSNCSPDARDSMLDMARAAKAAGIGVLCFTDHCDIDDFPEAHVDPNCFAFWPEALRQFDALRGQGVKGLDLRLGIELGEANHCPELAKTVAARGELDFVLGSVHNLRDTQDFYILRYESEAHCAALLERYLDELRALAYTDLDQSILVGIDFTIGELVQGGKPIHPDTTACRNEIILKRPKG